VGDDEEADTKDSSADAHDAATVGREQSSVPQKPRRKTYFLKIGRFALSKHETTVPDLAENENQDFGLPPWPQKKA